MTMPEPAAPRKPRKLWLFLPYGAVLILALGWCGYWFYGRSQLIAALEQAKVPGKGYTLAFASSKIGGFPFRYEIGLTRAAVSETSGWALAAPELQVEANAYDPSHFVAVAPKGLTLIRPGKGAVDITGEVLRGSFAGFSGIPRISLEATKLTLAPKAGAQPMPFSSADRFEAHIRPRDGDKAGLYFALTGALPAAGTTMARLTDVKSDIKIETEVSYASQLKGGDWPTLIRRWSAAGGEMTVIQAQARVGKAVLSVEKSGLAVDGEGRLRGKLKLKLREGSQGILALGATGVLPEETAAVGSGLAPDDASITLRFDGGHTLVGPLPIGKAPKVY